MTRIHLQHPRARVIGVLLFLSLGACDARPTQWSGVRLSAPQARPYAMLSVDGLSPDAASTVIRVGDLETTLVYDPAAATHRFLVPPRVSGPVRVTIPASATGRGDAVLRLQVLPTEFVGGSAQAELERMDATLARLVANVRGGVDSLGAAPGSALSALGANLERSAALFAQLEPGMTEADRVELASIYAANREMFELVADYLDPAPRASAAASAASGPRMGRVGHEAHVAGLPTAESLAQRCIQANLRLSAASDLLKGAAYFHFALPTILTLTLRNPAITSRVALFTNAFVVGLHSAILVQGRQPRFFDPDGLRLEPSRIRIRENGGTGELRAYVKMVGATDTAGRGDASYAKSLADFRKHYKNMNDVRRLTDWQLFRSVLKTFAVSEVIQLLDEAPRVLDEIYEDADAAEGEREVPIALDGLEISDVNNTRLWEFTSPAFGDARSFRTVGEVPWDEGLVIVALNATAGRGEACRARTHDGNPYEGRNGFLITGPPILRSASHSLVSVGTCQTTRGTGSLFNVRVNYFAANSMGPGARVDATWSFSPSGNTGSYSLVSNNASLGTQGDFTFGYCARYNDDESTALTFTAVDPEGLRSNARSISIPRPSGLPELRVEGASGGAAGRGAGGSFPGGPDR